MKSAIFNDEKVNIGRERYGSKVENPGDVDEAKWDKAKSIVKKEYGLSESADRFWKIVQGIYKQMTE